MNTIDIGTEVILMKLTDDGYDIVDLNYKTIVIVNSGEFCIRYMSSFDSPDKCLPKLNDYFMRNGIDVLNYTCFWSKESNDDKATFLGICESYKVHN